MVLLVDGNQWKLDRLDSFSLQHFHQTGLPDLLNTPFVRKRADTLKNTSTVTIESVNEILYVHQCEMVTVPYQLDISLSENADRPVNTALPKFIGTSEMTSCHAVLIHCSSGCVMGHLDGSGHGRLTEDFFKKTTDFFTTYPPVDANEQLQVHIIGGFIDSNDLSRKLTTEILTELLISHFTFRLRTLCCFILNDNLCLKNRELIHVPVLRGVVFDTVSSSIVPAEVPPRARGPLCVLRSAFSWSNESRLGMHNVFDRDTQRLVLQRYGYSEEAVEVASSFEHLSREELKRFSTTPRQETDSFFEMLRHSGRLIRYLALHKIDLFAGGPLAFVFDENLKHWYPDGPNAEYALKLPLTNIHQ